MKAPNHFSRLILTVPFTLKPTRTSTRPRMQVRSWSGRSWIKPRSLIFWSQVLKTPEIRIGSSTPCTTAFAVYPDVSSRIGHDEVQSGQRSCPHRIQSDEARKRGCRFGSSTGIATDDVASTVHSQHSKEPCPFGPFLKIPIHRPKSRKVSCKTHLGKF